MSPRLQKKNIDKGPLEFSKSFKNPCWYHNSHLRCMPYFYLAGFPKSGTTDVYKRITSHKHYVKGFSKECHWMTRKRFKDGTGGLLQYTWYFDRMSSLLEQHSITPEKRAPYITGDCSASTIWDNSFWHQLPGNEGFIEPRYTTADVIKQLNPDIKIIVILRNPTSRLYSDYLYFNKRKPNVSAEDFHEKVLTSVNDYNNCTTYHTLRFCMYTCYKGKPKPSDTTRPVRLMVGIYHVHLAEWIRVFPRDQLLVLKLEEDYSPEPEVGMRRVFRFLGLDPDLTTRRVAEQAPANRNDKTRTDVGEMLKKTRTLLDDFYTPHNKELAKLLKNDKFNYA